MSIDKVQAGGCYAERLGGCGGGLSREHPASEAVLKEIDQGDGVEVSGMSWLPPGAIRALPPSALASRVLCRRHNSYLSPNDKMAARAFSAIGAAIRMANGEGAAIPTKQIEPNLFGGWILKWFCGLAFSGQPTDPAGKRVDLALEEEWIQALFGQQPWPSRWNTAFLRSGASPVYTKGGGLEISPLHVGERIAAIEVLLHGIRFALFLGTVPRTLEGAQVIPFPLRLAFTSLRTQAASYVDFTAQGWVVPPTIITFQFTGEEQPD